MFAVQLKGCSFISDVSQSPLGLNDSLLVFCKVNLLPYICLLVLNFIPLKKFSFFQQVLFETAFSGVFTKTVHTCEVMCAAEQDACFSSLDCSVLPS